MKKLTNKGSMRGWWFDIDRGNLAIGWHSNRDELSLYFLCFILAFMKR